ncbi:hypothetical protein B0A54_08573 [Friedmanniomyces endolithicus]|uniref:Thioesterase domain-containing protein n=1 Tax=Friedmanniomyces endolithicus TaxID=329885 RepID=A0A4U0UTE7_9PEZI|nr:hypothetical protein B0A54_08573 [Friedmanniomyces endolithicus]
MALHRGIQSVIFFYLSCAPCSDARYRKRRKQEAQRDRLDKADFEAQMPNLYRHPSPSSTNPHWQAEIALGPVPTSRGGKRKATPSSDHQRGNGGLKTSGTTSSDGSEVASSTNVGRLRTPDERNDSKYSFGQHQRRDEDQWYSTAGETPLRSFMDGSMPSRPAKAHTKTSSSYLASGNPPINDWHPATVTKVSSREDVAWMLQPPPIAEVMSGKASAYGSRTNSTRSRPSVNSTPVSRQASERAKRAQVTLGALRDDTKGQRHDRSSGTPITTERDFAVSPSKRDRRRPEPLHLREASDDSGVTIIHRPLSTPELAPSRQPRTTTSRPQLSTILSDSMSPADVDTNTPVPAHKAENSIPSTRVSEASSSERDITARRPGPRCSIRGYSLRLLPPLSAAEEEREEVEERGEEQEEGEEEQQGQGSPLVYLPLWWLAAARKNPADRPSLLPTLVPGTPPEHCDWASATVISALSVQDQEQESIPYHPPTGSTARHPHTTTSPPAAETTTPPPPPRPRAARLLLTTLLLTTTLLASFAMAALPAAETINGFVSPPTDAETLTLYHPSTALATEINSHLTTHPLAIALRSKPGWTESRPHLKIPPAMRPHNLTGGTLLGEGKIAVPPLTFQDATAELPELVQLSYLGEALCGHPGIIHGGLLATLLDEGLARACFPALPNKVGVTASLKIDYRVPCPAGSYVVLRAQTTKVEGRKAWVKGWIEVLGEDGGEGVKVVEAEALFIEPRGAKSMARVYSTQ